LSIIYLLCAVFMFLKHNFHSNDNQRGQFSIQISQRVIPNGFQGVNQANNHLKIGLHSNNHLTLVNIGVVHLNGLGLTLSVNFIMKFIYISCKCKNKYIYMILCSCEKQYKCKINTFI